MWTMRFVSEEEYKPCSPLPSSTSSPRKNASPVRPKCIVKSASMSNDYRTYWLSISGAFARKQLTPCSTRRHAKHDPPFTMILTARFCTPEPVYFPKRTAGHRQARCQERMAVMLSAFERVYATHSYCCTAGTVEGRRLNGAIRLPHCHDVDGAVEVWCDICQCAAHRHASSKCATLRKR